jgi:MSHA biogenesis protein MshP
MIKSRSNRNGFAIAAALGILVICAVFGVFFMKMFNAAQESTARDAMGERAYQAARAGAEYAAYQSLVKTTCAPSTPSLPGFTEFTVSLTCARTSTSEGGTSVNVDAWTITTCTTASCPGTATAGYVERQIKVVFAK